MENKQIKNTIVKLLNNIGSEGEIRKYLNRFSGTESTSFAVIKVGGQVLKDDLDNLVSSICFLQQVGLTPIIVHGAGPQLNEKLEEHGIPSEFQDGKRITTSDILHLARKVFHEENQKLVSALKKNGADAVSLTSGVFDCRLAKNSKGQSPLGLVGDIKRVSSNIIDAIIQQGAIPVISPLGETDSGQIVNINADSATFAIALKTVPYKVVFLTNTGGLLDQNGRLIPVVSLSNDFDALIKQPWVHSGMLFKLQQIKALLEQLPGSTSVSMTKPSLLAKELFTHRGSGTLVNLGESIHSHTDWKSIDKEKVTRIIESGFGKSLDKNYFDNTPLDKAFLTQCERGLVIVSKEFSIPYLDKFCVYPQAKGDGIGSNLWSKSIQNYKKLFWRAKPNNPINKFYLKVADGFQKNSDWNIYWYGDIRPEEIADCIHYAKNKEVTIGRPS